MNVPKVDINAGHRKWCQSFMTEQAKSSNLVRDFLKRSRMYNPFSSNKKIDNILKRYGKSFW